MNKNLNKWNILEDYKISDGSRDNEKIRKIL